MILFYPLFLSIMLFSHVLIFSSEGNEVIEVPGTANRATLEIPGRYIKYKKDRMNIKLMPSEKSLLEIERIPSTILVIFKIPQSDGYVLTLRDEEAGSISTGLLKKLTIETKDLLGENILDLSELRTLHDLTLRTEKKISSTPQTITIDNILKIILPNQNWELESFGKKDKTGTYYHYERSIPVLTSLKISSQPKKVSKIPYFIAVGGIALVAILLYKYKFFRKK